MEFMLTTKAYQFWFITGSQHLYGPETLEEVADHSQIIAKALDEAATIPFPVVFKRLVTTPEEIRRVCVEASSDDTCAGVITWMHTFSPAKMWIHGLSELRKPLLHLHTQFNRDIPWDSIDMDFMNMNQSAHGDREFGHIFSRLGMERKVITGYWEHDDTRSRIAEWMGSAIAYSESKNLKVARFGDNMREVSVTEGDKVEAQLKLGWSINGYGIGDLVARMNDVSDQQVKALLDEYSTTYTISDATRNDSGKWASIAEQAKIEIGLKNFLVEGGFGAFTTTFEDLHGMKQLPGLAVQRLMEQGYGFGGEGDWKTSALTRLMKLIANNKGTSFMEDYTYHLDPANEMILGSHMLEICPTIAEQRPSIEVHPLGIGGKADPARLVFNGQSGKAIVASIVDLGNRFRLIVNQIEAVTQAEAMPNLPVARVLWKPEPSLRDSTEAWIYAGGAHHTVFSYVVTTQQLVDWAAMVGIECVVIDQQTTIRNFLNELRWNDLSYRVR